MDAAASDGTNSWTGYVSDLAVPEGSDRTFLPSSGDEESSVDWLLTDYELQCRHGETCHAKNDRYGAKFADPAFHIGGWLQQGFTANFDNAGNSPVLFNDQANEYQLNQLYFYMAKEARTDQWDIGGRVDVMFGTDSRFVTVPGLEEHADRSAKWNGENEEYGFALPQVYFDISSPLGPYGSLLRIGHFYALGGYETFAAPDNFFYSHAYTYLYGEAFTHTGAMWMSRVNESTAVAIAGTTGWDSFSTNLDEWGVQAGMMTKFNDGATTLAFTGYTGKNFTGVTTATGQLADPRSWASVVLKQCMTPSLYYVAQGDFGYQGNAVVQVQLPATVTFDSATWWGLNQYLVYEYDEEWSFAGRFEWFRDDGNSRISVPIEFTPGGPAFNGQDYFALTAGVNWKPHSNLIVRKELRWDWSNVESNPGVPGAVPGIRPFNNRSDDNQLTLGMDAIVLF